MLRGAKILVTGGAGYIGSHAVRRLCDMEAHVVVLDSLRTGHEAAVDHRAELIVGDVRDEYAIARALGDGTVACMHFAALALVGESVKEPERYRDVNVEGTRRLAGELVGRGVQAMVFSSTAAVYGDDVPTPIPEEQPLAPCNPYGQSKADAEQVLRETEGLRATCLRYFNAAGAMPDGTLGEDHAHETHLIPLAIGAAAGDRDALTIFGTDWDTRDGTCVRDYVHVLDLIDAHVAALLQLLVGAPGTAYNLGTGTGSTVREVLDAVERVVGPVPVVEGERRPGDPRALVAQARRAMSDLGWRPTHDLDAIVRDAWMWHGHHPDGYRTRQHTSGAAPF